MCCRTSIWKVCLIFKNPSPCIALHVALRILSCGCKGSVSARAAFRREMVRHSVSYSCVPCFRRAFQVLSCSQRTSLASISCFFLIRSASACPVGFSSSSPRIWCFIYTFQSSACLLKKIVSILWEKSGRGVRAGCVCSRKSIWGS